MSDTTVPLTPPLNTARTRIRITSGLAGRSARVFIGDQEVRRVAEVRVELPIDDIVRVHLTVLPDDLELDADALITELRDDPAAREKLLYLVARSLRESDPDAADDLLIQLEKRLR